nr:Asd/ArgC dimerization domain-containing protein [Litorivivens lipolytica]
MQDERVDYPVFWALPNPALSALAPVLDGLLAGNELLSVSALICESASAQGEQGTRQLAAETARLLNGQGLEGDGPQMAFNLLPGMLENAERLEQGLQDLLGIDLSVCRLDSVQLPLFYGQGIHLTATLAQPVMLDACVESWRELGVHIVENKKNFSTVTLAEDDRIHVSKIQAGRKGEHSLRAWIIADNVRKSAVVNTTRLIEILIKSSI